MNKRKFGSVGEDVACSYLEEMHYKIFDRNFYFRGGEIDIIAYDCTSEEIVFLEVKTRASKNYGSPAESVGKNKIKRIMKGANYYLYKNGCVEAYVRFDVLEILYKDKTYFIKHLKQVI